MADDIFPSQAPYPKACLGWDGTDFYVLAVDNTGKLQVVATLTPPAGGWATAANQATMITALQLIDDLRNTLQSVNTDALQVRGEDQLFSYKSDYNERILEGDATAGFNSLYGSAVPAGEIWVVTTLVTYNDKTACSTVDVGKQESGIDYIAKTIISAEVREACCWAGHIYLASGNKVWARFGGCNIGDDLYFYAMGYKMSKE